LDYGTKVSVSDLLVRACAVALPMHPAVNASWAGDKILRHRRINVGAAVAIDDALIVPVICDTDRKSLTEIAIETRALADRARAGRLRPEEFTGGTFTISNLGMFGGDHFTAVINPAPGSHPRRRARPPTKRSSSAWWSSGRPSS